MARDIFPYEIKRLIYDYVDLQTLKCLGWVSKAWASVGLELLLLPSFFVKSYSIDLHRLIDIGKSPTVSRQATNVLKKTIFQSKRLGPQIFP
jgi:hypothetical protein